MPNPQTNVYHKSENCTKKCALGRDLDRIERTYPVTEQRLSARARRWASFMVEVLLLHYEQIAVSLDELTRIEFRVTGQTCSPSTTKRALRELEEAGYLRRQKYRVGEDHFRVRIHLNRERFSWWLKRREYRPTSVYISPYRSKRPEDPRTDHPRSKPVDQFNVQTAGGDTKNKPKVHRHHPVIYSLMMVTKRNPRRKAILAAARAELANPEARESGVDWDGWSLRWQGISDKAQREMIARNQILPYVETALEDAEQRNGRPLPPKRTFEEELALRMADAGLVPFTGIPEAPPPAPPPPTVQTPEECLLTEQELQILQRARARCR